MHERHGDTSCSSSETWPQASSVVFAVIPVFNRLEHTRACLDDLFAQSYRPLHIIVVDGGSTDGTVEQIQKDYPQVDLLRGNKELWWGEGMELGIERCLARSRRQDDCVLMMNNDSRIDADYVATLVRVSREHHAAVSGVVVASHDTSRILDAGEFIDWGTYSFPVKTKLESGETYVDGVDLLSGRGTLIPLSMIRQAGNVNGKRFPHYIADCEFFARLKRAGCKLGVSCETALRSREDLTGLSSQRQGVLTLRQAWSALFSKRSMDNVRNHWRFIHDSAPAELRGQLKWKLIRRSTYVLMGRTVLGHAVLPLVWFVSGSYYVTRADCVACGCDPDALLSRGLMKPWRRDDWYVLEPGFRERTGEREEYRRLYRSAWNPWTKVSRWCRAKMCKDSVQEDCPTDHGQPSVRQVPGLSVPVPGSTGLPSSPEASGQSEDRVRKADLVRRG